MARGRDKVYLIVLVAQLVGILLLDLVPFYPTVLQRRLVGVRSWWSASSGDPYYGSVPHEPWLASFMYIEVLAQLPLTLYLVYRLSRLRLNTTGPTELAAVAYGCLTCMGSLACCFDIWHMGPDRVSDKQKWQLLWGTYLPFVVIPGIMTVDMYLRLLEHM